MTRKDISVNINNGEFLMYNKNNSMEVYPSNLCDYSDFSGMLDTYIYLNINIYNEDIFNEDICVYIPYIPVEKQVMISVNNVKNGVFTPIINPTTNDIWFKISLYDREKVYASELGLINQDGNFLLSYSDGKIYIYDYNNLDMVINDSIYQDAQILIKNYISSNTRHPLSGVGIQQYLNSPQVDRQLSNKILKELNEDGIIPKSVVLNGGVVALDLDEDNKSLGYEEKQQIR